MAESAAIFPSNVIRRLRFAMMAIYDVVIEIFFRCEMPLFLMMLTYFMLTYFINFFVILFFLHPNIELETLGYDWLFFWF